ncbi:hypothetical protein [Streptomyces sp. NPDC058861]|uniref:hypothetical protein n=1 Tax=Streptomyces sp. NPDC058861 TaxID=3346653 RepID=UPI0036825182
MIHFTPEAIYAEQQERLRYAGQQRLVAAAAAERRRQLRAVRAARPSRIRRAVRALRRTVAQGLRTRRPRQQQEGTSR